MENDSDGESQNLWGEHYPILLRGKVVPVAQRFSIEDLCLSKRYSAPGMMNHERNANDTKPLFLRPSGHCCSILVTQLLAPRRPALRRAQAQPSAIPSGRPLLIDGP